MSLGWVGFAIVAISVLGLAAFVPVAFGRTRVSALPRADAVERDLLAEAGPLTIVPVTQVVVPSTPEVGPTPGPRRAFRV